MSSYSDLASQIIAKNGQGGKFSGLNTALDLRQAFKDAGTQFAMQQQLAQQQGYNTGVAGIISSANMFGNDPGQAIEQYRQAVKGGINGPLPTANPNGAGSLATGTPTPTTEPTQPTATPSGQPAAGTDTSGRNEAYLAQVSQFNPGRAATIKAMADYKGDASKLGGRYGMALQDQVNRYDPNFDAANYNERKTFINGNWNKGDLFKNRQAIENTVQHLDLLQQNFDKMNNGQVIIANAAGNAAKVQLGNSQITNAMTDAKAVGTEMAKVLRGGGMLNEKEQLDTQKQLEVASSPEQMHGVIQQMMNLMAPRMNSALENYKGVMGRYPNNAFSPEAINAIKNISPDVYNQLAPKLGQQAVQGGQGNAQGQQTPDNHVGKKVGQFTITG